MKKGKNVKLNLSNYFKSAYGTVDSKDLKSIYINIQSWVTPKQDSENWNRIVGNFGRELKHTVFQSIDNSVFIPQSIVDLDLRTSGIFYGKKSFLNLEINLFTEKDFDFKSNELKNSIKKIINNIQNINITPNEYFDFTITKK
jgi:hypothetical protein